MFIQNHTNQQEGRVDVMAKYCLRRLSSISKKGPRGKPPMIAEIETASVSGLEWTIDLRDFVQLETTYN
jgi:hypothetical protein